MVAAILAILRVALAALPWLVGLDFYWTLRKTGGTETIARELPGAVGGVASGIGGAAAGVGGAVSGIGGAVAGIGSATQGPAIAIGALLLVGAVLLRK
jgi:hypothetical protein